MQAFLLRWLWSAGAAGQLVCPLPALQLPLMAAGRGAGMEGRGKVGAGHAALMLVDGVWVSTISVGKENPGKYQKVPG